MSILICNNLPNTFRSKKAITRHQDILHEFVEKIVVHAASDPKGKNRTQEIDIYYKDIGALEVSKVTSSRQE